MHILSKLLKHSVLFTFLFLLFILIFAYNFKPNPHNFKPNSCEQFVYLADSFLHGKLYFQPEHFMFLTFKEADGSKFLLDTALWQGRYYWPLGPMPALLLMPFVAIFGTIFLQGYISFFLTILNFWLIYRLAITLKHTNLNAIYLAIAFIFGSTYIGIAVDPTSWFFAQVLGTSLSLLSLYEYFCQKKRRWWLIGIYLGLAMATRLTLGLGTVFFLWLLATEQETNKLKRLLELAAPIFISFLLLMSYNYARFQNPWESGYKLQHTGPMHLAAKNEGLFNIKNIPGNSFVLLFNGPLPIKQAANSTILKYPYIVADPWGIGIFFTTPILVYLLLYNKRNNIIRGALITSGIILIPILTFYGIGYQQFGYRYAMDFLPFLFVALILTLAPQLPNSAKWVIIISTVLNVYMSFYFQIFK